MSNAVPSPEELLTELRFAQRIALHLVRDHHLADEVAQEAVMAALDRPDVAAQKKRAWIAGVVRNLVDNRGREARRRTQREARYAQDTIDAGGHVAENAAQEALQRGEQKARVAGAVMGLPEPYRTVVVLRYMEELSPPEVAAELGRPVETVKTQLRRGMAKLRDDLDAQSGGDGSSWALALLPLVAPVFPLGVESGLAAASVAGAAWAPSSLGGVPGWAAGFVVLAALAAVTLVGVGALTDSSADDAQPETIPWIALEPATVQVERIGQEFSQQSNTELAAVTPAPTVGAHVALESSVPAAELMPVDVEVAEAVTAAESHSATLRVVDAETGRPIEGALVE